MTETLYVTIRQPYHLTCANSCAPGYDIKEVNVEDLPHYQLLNPKNEPVVHKTFVLQGSPLTPSPTDAFITSWSHWAANLTANEAAELYYQSRDHAALCKEVKRLEREVQGLKTRLRDGPPEDEPSGLNFHIKLRAMENLGPAPERLYHRWVKSRYGEDKADELYDPDYNDEDVVELRARVASALGVRFNSDYRAMPEWDELEQRAHDLFKGLHPDQREKIDELMSSQVADEIAMANAVVGVSTLLEGDEPLETLRAEQAPAELYEWLCTHHGKGTADRLFPEMDPK